MIFVFQIEINSLRDACTDMFTIWNDQLSQFVKKDFEFRLFCSFLRLLISSDHCRRFFVPFRKFPGKKSKIRPIDRIYSSRYVFFFWSVCGFRVALWHFFFRYHFSQPLSMREWVLCIRDLWERQLRAIKFMAGKRKFGYFVHFFLSFSRVALRSRRSSFVTRHFPVFHVKRNEVNIVCVHLFSSISIFVSIILISVWLFSSVHADYCHLPPDKILCVVFLRRCDAPINHRSSMVRRSTWARMARRAKRKEKRKKNWARRFMPSRATTRKRHTNLISIFWHNGRKQNFNNNRSKTIAHTNIVGFLQSFLSLSPSIPACESMHCRWRQWRLNRR